MKHPKFRVKSVLDLDTSVLDELEKVLRGIIVLLPQELNPQDIEIVGSYANGSADLHSDFDIAIPMKDWNEQMVLRRLLYGENKDLSAAIKNIAYQFEELYGIKLDINPIIPDNKENTAYATYSIFERKLYNKPADLNKRWLCMSNYIQKYFLKEYEVNGIAVDTRKDIKVFSSPVRFSNDEYAREVEEWRNRYRDKFIEYIILEDGQLSEC